MVLGGRMRNLKQHRSGQRPREFTDVSAAGNCSAGNGVGRTDAELKWEDKCDGQTGNRSPLL